MTYLLVGWVGIACLLAGCSDDGGANNDGGMDGTTPDGAKQDTGVADTGTGMDAQNDTGSNDAGDSGTVMDAAADSGNVCWTGTKAQCGTCCTTNNTAGATFWANNAGNCMCANGVCGSNGTCGNSICQGANYTANCQTCLQTKFVANGPCPNEYTACQGNGGCKAWAACMVGCP